MVVNGITIQRIRTDGTTNVAGVFIGAQHFPLGLTETTTPLLLGITEVIPENKFLGCDMTDLVVRE